MHRSIRLAVLGVAAALTSTGCASIISDSSYPVAVNSSPDGATVTIRNENGVVVHRGATPFTVTLPASDGFFDGMDYTLEVEGGGTTVMSSGLDGWYFGNILFGGLLGLLIIDPATGAMYDLPETVHVSAIRQ